MPDIYDIIASVNALLPEGTTAQVGAEHYSEHTGAAARVLWVPGKDTFAAPPNRGWSPRRPIHRCDAQWMILCFGRGDDKADPFASMRATTALRDVVLAALDDVAAGDHKVLSGQFEGQDGSVILQAGRLYILQVSFSTAVLERERLVLAPITSAVSTVDLPPENGSRIVVETTEIP